MLRKKMQTVTIDVFLRRCQSNMPHLRTASQIRREFIDYFANLDHAFVRSSPVSLLTDRSVAFVNAGMNQFKGVLLDYYEPPAPKIVNSQKCIRVGGKHNDLSIVGTDTYHHTFFEMLGNWSFHNYFKKEACRYAWDLLTGPYGINKEFLYVTYFAGDEALKLEPDLECKDIWLNLGVPEDRILPFGMQDNFWEMALSGPCGPCTEIHVDHKMRTGNQSAYVNKGHADLTELWNLVFIQYERLTNGTIAPLSKHHVDTGMGFERLVALLQGKSSNYDTDLFQPLFETIQKYSKAPQYKGLFGLDDKNKVDYGYRILADHGRMIAVTLADGMIPEENPKIRRILRRAIDVSETTFKKEGLLSQLVYTVAESLGDVYPELQNNLKQVLKIIDFEQDLFKRLQNTSGKEWKKLVETRPKLSLVTEWMTPGLVDGYKDLQSMLKYVPKNSVLPGDIAYKLYDTYGLSVDTISELAQVESLTFDETLFLNEFEKAKQRSRVGISKTSIALPKASLQLLEKNQVPPTDDCFKYKYVFNGCNYEFPTVQAKIAAVIEHEDNDTVAIVLDKTPFYTTEGGQCSDKGYLRIKDLVLKIDMVEKVNSYVVHYVNNLKGSKERVQTGDECTISIDSEARLGAMRNHTGTHLLNAALKQVFDVVHQRGSVVGENGLKFQFNPFGEKLSLEQLTHVENLVNDVISASVPVTTEILNSLQLLTQNNVTLHSGEIYPLTGIRLVQIDTDVLKSKEACCGTHVYNTKDLVHFCLLSYSSKGRLNRSIKAVVGPSALMSRKAGEALQNKISQLESDCRIDEADSMFDQRVKEIQRSISTIKEIDMNNTLQKVPLPHVIREECLTRLQNLTISASKKLAEFKKKCVIRETKAALVLNEYPFFVYHLSQNEPLPLHEITNLCPHIPVLVISHCENTVIARCCVPTPLVSDIFNAQTWMEKVMLAFGTKNRSDKNTNSMLEASTKFKHIPPNDVNDLIRKAVADATNFAVDCKTSIKT